MWPTNWFLQAMWEGVPICSILMIKRVPINSSHDFMKTVNYKLQGNLDLKYFNEKGCELSIHKWKSTALKKEHDKQR